MGQLSTVGFKKLQVNTAGAWRNVAEFHSHKRDAVVAALVDLSVALGHGVKWALVHEDGSREWLHFEGSRESRQ